MNDLALRIGLTGLLLVAAWLVSELPWVRRQVDERFYKWNDFALYGGGGLIFVAVLLWLWVGIDL